MRGSWSILTIGLVCGAVLTGLYFGYWQNEPGHFGAGIHSLLEPEAQPKSPHETPRPKPAPEPPPKVTLDYHRILPHIGEVIPSNELISDAEAKEATASSPRSTAESNGTARLAPEDEASGNRDRLARREPVEQRPEPLVRQLYALQAGSFRSDRDAETMKAKLALAGFHSVIQRVKIGSQGTYYRVRLGPYNDKGRLHREQKQLSQRGFTTISVALDNPDRFD